MLGIVIKKYEEECGRIRKRFQDKVAPLGFREQKRLAVKLSAARMEELVVLPGMKRILSGVEPGVEIEISIDDLSMKEQKELYSSLFPPTK